jgi:hypothetical protein
MIYRIYLGHSLPNMPRVLEYEAEGEMSPKEVIKLVKEELVFKVDRILILWTNSGGKITNIELDKGENEYA